MTTDWITAPALILLVGAATVTDVRHREVPVWLTVGGGLLGLLVAGANGWGTLWSSAVATVVGGVLLLPFVLRGGIGLGDAMVLAAVGSWGGWPFVLWAACWTAVAGGALGLLALWRRKPSFAYVPALAIGTAIALWTVR